MTKINEELQKIAAGMSKGNTPASSSIEPRSHLLPGDPNCPICGGVGYLRQDLPIGHPDFGKVTICSCRQAEVSQMVRRRILQLSNLGALSHLTFETFQPRGRLGLGEQQSVSLERAFSQARQFATTLHGWLLLQGGYGCGKTHLAAAVANYCVSIGVSTLFITVPDLLDWLRFAYESADTTFEERFDEIRNTGLLVMDDFGTQNATSWAQEKLFQILNHRYVNRLPLVVTSNQSLETIEGRVRSRLQDPELVTLCRILAPDFRNPTDDTGHPSLSCLGMHSQRTFSNFNLRQNEGLPLEDQKSLEKAFQSAKKFAENPQGWLVFSGPYGCGKTHLAAAIGNHRAALGNPPLMVVVPDLLDQLRSTFSPNSNVTYDERFEQYKNAPLLILDDLGTQSATPWAREKLYQLINHRYIAELPTVITTSDAPDEIDPRLRSRMLDARVSAGYVMNVPAYSSAPRKDKQLRRPRRLGE
ncbi:MAG: ATP-binding protein [Anaerolineaceae bacterium]|nr:ATP-binding protein [Anaerolineaceae bacterium]